LARNLGATLASTLISYAAYKRNLNFEQHNPSLALKFIEDFEVVSAITLTWQYFSVYILNKNNIKERRVLEMFFNTYTYTKLLYFMKKKRKVKEFELKKLMQHRNRIIDLAK